MNNSIYSCNVNRINDIDSVDARWIEAKNERSCFGERGHLLTFKPLSGWFNERVKNMIAQQAPGMSRPFLSKKICEVVFRKCICKCIVSRSKESVEKGRVVEQGSSSNRIDQTREPEERRFNSIDDLVGCGG